MELDRGEAIFSTARKEQRPLALFRLATPSPTTSPTLSSFPLPPPPSTSSPPSHPHPNHSYTLPRSGSTGHTSQTSGSRPGLHSNLPAPRKNMTLPRQDMREATAQGGGGAREGTTQGGGGQSISSPPYRYVCMCVCVYLTTSRKD